MALVMLPGDLPWWESVKRQLKKISKTKNTEELIEAMQKIYKTCKYVTSKSKCFFHFFSFLLNFSVSLDPDEEFVNPQQFVELSNFLDNELTSEERSTFFSKTLPSIANRALRIKDLRPKSGLHFSLQQQRKY